MSLLRFSTVLFAIWDLGTASPVARTSFPFKQSSHSSRLTRFQGIKQPSSKWLHEQLVGQVAIESEFDGAAFLTNITFGTQEFLVTIDTGSSDTWLAETGFTCVNITTNATIPQADCAFASTYTPDSSFQQIPDENFNISYADLEYLNGIVGYDTVTLAGIQVTHQEVGLANLAGWEGDNITSGLTGLAYPYITSAFAGTNASADVFNSSSSHLPYSPIINTIFFVENLTAPLFSLSLSRDPADLGFGGYLTIGGIPDISMPTINASSTFAKTPIEEFTDPFLGDTAAYLFYAITIDGLVYGSYAPGSGEANIQFIVDSGTTLNYFPTPDAKAFNALFDPPAYIDPDFGIYVVLCNATAPTLGVTISGETFYHNPADLINNEDLGDGLCLSGVQDGGALNAGAFVLGDVFLKNVLAVFDVGEVMMAFSSREYYASE